MSVVSSQATLKLITTRLMKGNGNSSAYAMVRDISVSNVGVLWLNAKMDRIGFQHEAYHTGQLLCITWGPDLPTERKTSPAVKADVHTISKKCP